MRCHTMYSNTMSSIKDNYGRPLWRSLKGSAADRIVSNSISSSNLPSATRPSVGSTKFRRVTSAELAQWEIQATQQQKLAPSKRNVERIIDFYAGEEENDDLTRVNLPASSPVRAAPLKVVQSPILTTPRDIHPAADPPHNRLRTPSAPAQGRPQLTASNQPHRPLHLNTNQKPLPSNGAPSRGLPCQQRIAPAVVRPVQPARASSIQRGSTVFAPPLAIRRVQERVEHASFLTFDDLYTLSCVRPEDASRMSVDRILAPRFDAASFSNKEESQTIRALVSWAKLQSEHSSKVGNMATQALRHTHIFNLNTYPPLYSNLPSISQQYMIEKVGSPSEIVDMLKLIKTYLQHRQSMMVEAKYREMIYMLLIEVFDQSLYVKIFMRKAIVVDGRVIQCGFRHTPIYSKIIELFKRSAGVNRSIGDIDSADSACFESAITKEISNAVYRFRRNWREGKFHMGMFPFYGSGTCCQDEVDEMEQENQFDEYLDENMNEEEEEEDDDEEVMRDQSEYLNEDDSEH